MTALRVIVADTETTGLDTAKDRIIELCVASWPLGSSTIYTVRLNPQIPIPPEASAINHIYDADVSEKESFAHWYALDAHKELLRADVWIGSNPQYDVDMLMAEMQRWGYEWQPPRILIDIKRIWDINEPLPRRGLETAYKRFVDPAGFANAHSASGDVQATAMVLEAQLEAFGLQGKRWEELDPERMQWWGPTNHIKYQDPAPGLHAGPDLRALVVQFGKHQGKCVFQVERGYWQWLAGQTDFPSHVKQMASAIIDVCIGKKTKDQVHAWARRQYP